MERDRLKKGSRPRRAFLLVALLVAVAGCGGDDPGPAQLSRAEAERELARVVALASKAPPEEFCSSPGVLEGHCRAHLEVGGAVPPSRPPVVLGTRDNLGLRSPGLILEICGTRHDGSVYFTDFLVVRVEGQLEVPDPVYWSGVSVSTGAPGELTAAPEPTPATPLSCPPA